MSQRKRKFFSGSTVEQAVIAAASEYGLAPGEVAYRKVEKKHGFLRMRKRIVIEVDPEAPQRAADDDSVEALPPIPVGRPRDAGFTRIPRAGASEGGAESGEEEAKAPAGGGRDKAPTKAGGGPQRKAQGGEERAGGDRSGRDGRDRSGRDGGDRSGSRDSGGRGGRSASDEQDKGQSRDSRASDRARDDRARDDRSGEDRSRDDRNRGDRGREDQHREGRDREDRGRGGRGGRGRDDRGGKKGGGRRIVDESMDLLDAAEDAVDRLLAVTGLELDFLVEVEDDRVELDLGGPDAEMLLEEDGKALYALELLIPILVRALCGQRVFCQVDSEGYRERREQELRELALEVAEEVAESGEEKTLDYLNPAERRIVHMALADHEEVETESEGRGYLKRLTVWPL